MANNVRPVRWELVDPWLVRLKQAGDLRRLSDALKISRLTLTLRRKELDLPKLKPGRAVVKELTELERDTMVKIKEEGMTQVEVAEERGVTPQAVHNIVARAERKLATKRCPKCDGYGVRACGSDGEKMCGVANGSGALRPAHNHICAECSGDGRIAG